MNNKLKLADRFLATHRRHCKVWVFSAQQERSCTCGRDELQRELEELRALKQAHDVKLSEKRLLQTQPVLFPAS